MKETIKKSLVGGLVFSLTAVGVFIVYATIGSTWTSPDNLQVGVGSGLTSDSRNKMLANMNYLNSKPLFSVYLNQASSATSETWTKIPFNAIEFDTNNFFNTSTNKFQPNLPGYYKLNLNANINGLAAGGSTLYASIYKNGSAIKVSPHLMNFTANFFQSVSTEAIVYLNGSSDYIEGYYWWNGGTASLYLGAGNTYMQGEFLRP